LLYGEVAILRPNVLELFSSRVENLYIACEVLVTVDFREVAKGLVCDFGHIKLMIADGQEIVIQVLKNRVRCIAVGCGGIAQSSAIMQILFLPSALPLVAKRVVILHQCPLKEGLHQASWLSASCAL